MLFLYGLMACVSKIKPKNNCHTTEVDDMKHITAQEMVSNMRIGWNLGDSLDVCNADRDHTGTLDEHAAVVDETLWGNVRTTKVLFDHLKTDGINAVRIPITWRDHLGDAPTYEINSDWMNRIEQVVKYAYDNDLYVIVNVHHDGGGDPTFGAWIRSASNEALKESVFAKFEAIWRQIADRFKNYNDKLIFESLNEVGFDDVNDEVAYPILDELNQRFVNIVRASDGNNPQRHLMIAGYWTDIVKTTSELYHMPTDNIDHHLILSIHYYTPWQFCVTNKQRFWGSPEEVTQMEELVNLIYHHFVAKGTPVIMGEYGFGQNDPASTVFFSEMFVKLCHNLGIGTFLWDNGDQYDRTNMYWYNPELIAALQRATSGEDYTVTKK